MKSLIPCLIVIIAFSATAHSDSIVVEGRKYEDVLVYESERFYFVKIPKIADVISVPKDGDVGEIYIDPNPETREKLRELYDKVKTNGVQPEADVDSAFQIEEPSTALESIDTAALLSGGGANAKPMNLTVDEAKAAFGPLQVQFTGAGDSITGKSADGVVNVTIKSEGGKVTYLTGDITSNDPAAIQQKAMGVVGMIGRLAPWANGWIMQNAQTVMTGGTIQKTQDGVGISISAGPTGLNFKVAGA